MNAKIFDSVVEAGEELGRLIAENSRDAIKARGCFTIAISGGSLPSILEQCLFPKYEKEIDWKYWHIFLADERCVPITHPDSNALLIKKHLCERVNFAKSQLHFLEDFYEFPDVLAEKYEQEIRDIFVQIPDAMSLHANSHPIFDMILLGMGPDGHTCSLFPGHSHDESRIVIGLLDSPKPPPHRVSLTMSTLNVARSVVFFVSGEAKSEAVKKVFMQKKLSVNDSSLVQSELLPASRVNPGEKRLTWLLDKSAASLLCQEL